MRPKLDFLGGFGCGMLVLALTALAALVLTGYDYLHECPKPVPCRAEVELFYEGGVPYRVLTVYEGDEQVSEDCRPVMETCFVGPPLPCDEPPFAPEPLIGEE